MVSIITSSNAHNLISPIVSSHRTGPDLKTSTAAALRVVNKDRFWGFKFSKKMRTRSGILCKGSLESDFELVLEGEILEFMKISRNPNDFPTKKELLDGGRIDLVDAIVKKGGWLSLGWNDENGWDSKEFDYISDLNTRFDNSLRSLTSCDQSHQCASSSGRSVYDS